MSQTLGKTGLLIVVVLVFCFSGFTGEVTQAEKIEPSPNLEEELHAGPKDIKEEVGIFVFLGWLWFSIFVMIYLLRQKIRETDRLHSYRYFTASEKTHINGS